MNNIFGSINGHCCFRAMIDCRDSSCLTCGWNPDVAHARIRVWEEKRRLSGERNDN